MKQEIEQTVQSISFEEAVKRFDASNKKLEAKGKRQHKGKQAIINQMFREAFEELNWECEKNVFDDPTNDLAIDFWKRNVGIDVAFNHRSFTGGDLLRLQAAAEVKNIMNVGVYICGTKEFLKEVSPKDASSMVCYERTKWYLENFHPVFTVPVLLIGLTG